MSVWAYLCIRSAICLCGHTYVRMCVRISTWTSLKQLDKYTLALHGHIRTCAVCVRMYSTYVECVQRVLVYPPQLVFKEYGRLTGYSLVLVHYIVIGKLWRMKWWWINENSLYFLYVCICICHSMYTGGMQNST